MRTRARAALVAFSLIALASCREWDAPPAVAEDQAAQPVAAAAAITSLADCEALVTTGNGVSGTELYRYTDCRFDRLEELLGAGPAEPSPSPTSSSTPSATPSPTATVTPTQTPTSTPTAGTSVLNLPRVPWEGGPAYYGKWTKNTLPTDPNFFPVGVWMEQGWNAPKLAGYGINVLVNPVGQQSTDSRVKNLGALEDEADMWGGPGDAAWTGKFPGQGDICNPANQSCGYTIMKTHQAGVEQGEHRYANYGKGVGFWETNAQAARFVNEFQDTVSIDLYWGTDNDLCQASQGGALLGLNRALTTAECRRSSNYGAAVERVRKLLNPAASKPVYNYVELGHPGTNGGQMPVDKIAGAVWSSLIHEARGVVYFNHSFGGTCQSQHVLDDCDPAIRAEVTRINAQIKQLAPVLNSQSYQWSFGTGLDTMLKAHDGYAYVFAMTDKGGTGSRNFTLPAGTTGNVEVVGENRSVTVSGGKFTDTFAAESTTHIYRVKLA